MNGFAQLVSAHEARLRLATSGLPVRLIVRSNVPWETMTEAEFYAQDGWLLTHDARTRLELVKLWEAAYRLDYRQYRAKIRDACDAVNMRAPWDNVSRGFDGIQWEASDEILVCVDDDDTIDEPGLIAALKTMFVPGINVVRWPRRMNVLGYVQPDSMFPTTYLDTCNWAVRKSFLCSWDWKDSLEMLAFHWVAHSLIGKRFRKPDEKPRSMYQVPGAVKPTWRAPFENASVLALPKAMSTYYVHTGSISYLATKAGNLRGAELTGFLRGKPLHPLYMP